MLLNTLQYPHNFTLTLSRSSHPLAPARPAFISRIPRIHPPNILASFAIATLVSSHLEGSMKRPTATELKLPTSLRCCDIDEITDCYGRCDVDEKTDHHYRAPLAP